LFLVRRTKEEALETRDRILDAAEAVFQERGVGHTSLAEIAAAAGVTRGAIYWHFENKVDLFDAMIQRVFDPLEAQLSEVQTHPTENPIDALRRLTIYFIDRVANDPRYMRVLEISWHKCEYVGDMAKIRDSHLECGNRYLSILEEGFRLARERGFVSTRADARQAAVGLMAVVDGLIVNWTLDRELFPLASYGPAIVDAYLAGVAKLD
jgi:TetR/AcrR family transcriptional regulator, acrAB operon repressor